MRAVSDELPTGARHAAEVLRPWRPSDGGTRPERVPDGPYDAAVRFEVIGPLRIVAPVDAGPTRQPLSERSLGGPKPRLVLALLLAEPNVTVSIDRLIDGVWGDDPPESARHTLQAYVSELRKAVGEVIERDGTGYVLRVSRSELDALDFEARVSEGLALAERDPGRRRKTSRRRSPCGGAARTKIIPTSRRSRPRRPDSRS